MPLKNSVSFPLSSAETSVFFIKSLEKGREEYQMGASVEERVSLWWLKNNLRPNFENRKSPLDLPAPGQTKQ